MSLPDCKVPVHKRDLDAAVEFMRKADIDYALPMPKNPRSKRFVIYVHCEGDAVLVAAYVTPWVQVQAAA
jgi:hypothetical protein